MSNSAGRPDAPFRGIEPFRYVDHSIFFERAAETRRLVRYVTMYRGALLYGESGTGKSSLINAGFIPEIIEEGFTPDRLRVQPLRKQEIIVERISLNGNDRAPFLPSNFDATTDGETYRLILSLDEFKARLKQAAVAERLPLLIFDQFEEFVTLFEVAPQGDLLKEAQAAQAAILDVIVSLLRDESLPVKLLFVFREDYLAKLTNLFVLYPNLTDQYVRIVSPQTTALEKIINGPFSGGDFGGFAPELVRDLTAAIKARSRFGTLNLSEVQIVCKELWEAGDKAHEIFRQKEIQGLLEDYFSDALGRFDAELRDPAIALLSRMVTSVGTRNIVSEYDLIERVRDDESIDVEILKKALHALQHDAKVIRREPRHEVYFYEIVSEFLVPWINRQKVEREKRRLLAQVEERNLIDRFASADQLEPQKLALLLANLSAKEETVLRASLGDDGFSMLRERAQQARKSVRSADRKGNVVVIPGYMGSELSSFNKTGLAELIWVNAFRLMRGDLRRLRLAEDGVTPANKDYEVRATGIMKRYYGEMVLSLSERWNVKAFWFDWRKDLLLAADELHKSLLDWFGDEPVHIVAHSQGGRVARALIKKYPSLWASMWDGESGELGGRLIMLGVGNHGSFTGPQILCGLESMLKKLSQLDLRSDLAGVSDIFNTFPGIYQALPSPLLLPSVEPLYHAEAYGRTNVSQRHLDDALEHHRFLADVVDPQRMVYVAGDNKSTYCGIKDWNSWQKTLDAYQVTLSGDGSVPHILGLLKDVPTYYINEEHGNLSSNATILAVLDDLLRTGRTDHLSEKPASQASTSPSDS